MESIAEGLNYIYEFLVNGSYTFVQEIFAEISIWCATWYFKIKLSSMVFFWGVAQATLDSLNVSSLIEQYWVGVNPSLKSFLSRYNVLEAMNIVLTSHVTAFIWRLI